MQQPADVRAELERLYRSHFQKVAGYFRRSGEADAVAQELAQETFIHALRGLSSFQGHSKLSTWLWSIARNVLLAHLRTQRTARAALDDSPEPIDPDSLMSHVDTHLTDMCDCIRRGFAEFAREHPDRAQVLYLAAVEGWSIKDLADFLGRTPHAATEYLSQCRAKLRPYIEHCNDAG